MNKNPALRWWDELTDDEQEAYWATKRYRRYLRWATVDGHGKEIAYDYLPIDGALTEDHRQRLMAAVGTGTFDPATYGLPQEKHAAGRVYLPALRGECRLNLPLNEAPSLWHDLAPMDPEEVVCLFENPLPAD
jgi:hypothetical protein